MNAKPISAKDVIAMVSRHNGKINLDCSHRGFCTIYKMETGYPIERDRLVEDFVSDYNNSDFDPDK